MSGTFSPNSRRGGKSKGEFRENSKTRGSKSHKKFEDGSNNSLTSPRERKDGNRSTTDIPIQIEVEGSSQTTNNKPIITLNAKDNALMYDRSLWIFMNLVGKPVEVQVKSGEIFEGVLHTASTEKGVGVVLKMARKKLENKKETITTRPIPTFVIYPSDFVQLYAKDVSFDVRSDKEFATDTDISAHGVTRERELVAWVPDENIEVPMDLNFESKGRNTSWDQFEVNKQLFGVQTSWDERYYTTEIKREGISDEEWRERTRKAAKLAAEIEGQPRTISNPHLAEERGAELDIDEEERYGAVIRESITLTTTNPGIYIPPSKRQQMKEQAAQAAKEQALHKEKQKEVKEQEPKTPPLSRIPGSPGSPVTSPLLSPGKSVETHPIVAERLRIRQHMVTERLKNSAPVPEKPIEQSNFPSPKRSPLISPLIGDPRGVNALSLEPSSPHMSEDVLADFYNFSLKEKKAQAALREKTMTDFKNFSQSLEKKVTHKGSAQPSEKTTQAAAQPVKISQTTGTTTQLSTTVPAKTATPVVTSTKAEKPVATPVVPVTVPTKTPAVKVATPYIPSQPQASTKEPEKEKKNEKTDKKPEKKEEHKEEKREDRNEKNEEKDEDKDNTPKLNPNAKVFKPMSANAPSFTPSGPPTTPAIPSGDYIYQRQLEDPYMYPGPRPSVFTVPFVGPQVIPGQGIYPRVPYIYPPPNGQQLVGPYPPVVYNPGQTLQPQGKRYVPPQPTKGTTGPVASNPNPGATPAGSQTSPSPQHYPPNYIPGQRMISPGYYPMQYQIPIDPTFPHPVIPGYPQGASKGEPKKEEQKFQGVPNADNFYAPTQKEDKKPHKE